MAVVLVQIPNIIEKVPLDLAAILMAVVPVQIRNIIVFLPMIINKPSAVGLVF